MGFKKKYCLLNFNIFFFNKKARISPGPIATANLQGLKNKEYASVYFQNNGSYPLQANDADLY